MNILLLGSGGREHALAWKIRQSPLVHRLFCAPANPGIAQCGEAVTLDTASHQDVIGFCRKNLVDLVVIGPEAPLVAGLANDLAAADIACFGPHRIAAQLEGSKGFTKDLCARFGIPTAEYQRFTDKDKALAHVRHHGAPLVIKADGLAAGKGVVVAQTLQEAEDAVEMMFAGALGEAGASVVIEEFLEGEEASFFVLSDGISALPFGTAQDHKRLLDGDQGPNTGGMGAYSPAPVVSAAVSQQVMETIIHPTLAAMREMGCPYRGVLYAGLMLTAQGPKLIEYNVRFGDPECQVLMMRLQSDLVPLLLACARGGLDAQQVQWNDAFALTVVMATSGYPGRVIPGSMISGLQEAAALPDVQVFHAGTRHEGGVIVANGGRVLNVTATGPDARTARTRAYEAVQCIRWPEGIYRSDIGWRVTG